MIENTVIEVKWYLSGGTRPGGTDLIILYHWLLQFGEASDETCKIFAEFAEWLAKNRPLWAIYWVLVFVRLIVIDKHPRVSPMGVRDIW